MIWHLYRVELNQCVHQKLLEILQHANNFCTRTYAVGALARFNKSSTYRSCKALVRVLIYLRDTTERGIQFTGSDFELFGCRLRW